MTSTPLPNPLRTALFCAALAGALSSASAGDGATDSPTATASRTKRPNIVFILADDLGYSDIHAFGGEIDTPNLDVLAATGRLLTNHHTGTVCAITRAMLMSGTDHHLVGEGTMGAPSDERKGLPGYEGYLNDRALSMAQLLKDAGYHTYMAGKWHLGSSIATPDVSARLGSSGQTPDQWGFEKSFALLGGAARNHFAHEPADSKNYAEDGAYVQPGQPGQPGGKGGSPTVFYSTDFYTRKLIADIDSNHADGRPFYAYAAYTAPHWPLQVPEPYLHKYAGRYDAGYEAVRAARIARQKQLGLVPTDFTPWVGLPESLASRAATPANDSASAAYLSAVHGAVAGYVDYGPGLVAKRWSSLTPLERKAQARYMEIYAGMVDNLDHDIGLLIQHLKDIGEYDNTLIIFQSDNGAEAWPIGPASADPRPIDEANAIEPAYSALGTDNGRPAANRLQYGTRWAEVSATPFRQTKGYSGEGGVSTPLIVHLAGQTRPLPNITQFTHVTDITATILAAAGATLPTRPAPAAINALTGVDTNKGKVVYDNRYVYPVTGKSLLALLVDADDTRVHTTAFGDEAYGRAYLRSADGRWKALWTDPPTGPLDGHWELFDLRTDRGENKDVSSANPLVLRGLVDEWTAYMRLVGGVEPVRPRGYY